MVSALLLPLHGAFLVIWLVTIVLRVFALIDAIARPESAYVSAGKQTKVFWVVLLVVGLLITIVGLIASIVYLVDVRPAIRASGGGRGSSSSDGPYGPYRG